jgi:hypothetical protein
MSKLHELFPTAESLLELTPDTLAPILLRIRWATLSGRRGDRWGRLARCNLERWHSA